MTCVITYRLKGRGQLRDETIQDLEKTNDDDNASVISVDITEGTGYSTTWGPVGFSRIHHAFAIMVSYHWPLCVADARTRILG